MQWVYAIYNRESEKIYVGETNNIIRRLQEHNDKQHNKRYYTSRFPGTWQLIYQEELPSRKEALRRERELKSFRGWQFLRTLLNTIPE